MKKILVITFFLIYGYSFGAKIPGYRGLRFSLQYHFALSPQWRDFSNSPMPYLSHNAQIGYVVSRKHEVGISYTRLDYSSNCNFFVPTGDQASDAIHHRSFSGNNVLVYVKFFRSNKGFIAPLGRYTLLGLGYEYSVNRFSVNSSDYSSGSSQDYTKTMVAKSHDLHVTLGMGRNFILFNRMLLSIEGDINVPITSGIRAATTSSEIVSYYAMDDVSIQKKYKHINALDALLMNLVQIKIGLGVLAF